MTTHRPVTGSDIASSPYCRGCGSDPHDGDCEFHTCRECGCDCAESGCSLHPRAGVRVTRGPQPDRPVTGPDGDNPITDEQIRELRDDPASPLAVRSNAHGALNKNASEDVRQGARARCAAAYNARHAGKE